MIRFQIPKPYLPGFETLLYLLPDQVEKIVDFLRSVPVGTGPQVFSELFSKTLKSQTFGTAAIGATIYSLGHFRLNPGKATQEEIIDGFIHSFNEQSVKKFNEEELKNLSDVLFQLFGASTNIALTFKAFQLLSENESVIKDNHIVTDIRLLFDEDLKHPNRHGLLVHQLKLVAEEDEGESDYFFNLSVNDLQKLKDQINRALEKEALIRKDYGERISFINITE